MFADAYEKAAQFTSPLVISHRQTDGTVACAVAAYVVLNPDGWIVTAAHVFNVASAARQHSVEIKKHTREVKKIAADNRLDAKRKRKKIMRLRKNREWITNFSYWWGGDGLSIGEVTFLGSADLALAQLQEFDASFVAQYPVMRAPENLRSGTSLCRLGYPFHEISATFDEATGSFTLEPGALPIPRFPIEGIFTRQTIVGKEPKGRYEIKLIETSSPGLKGQSGGPIFDTAANVWGIQSSTNHIPLGFSPTVRRNGREVVEHQFLNVGLGTHPETLCGFLDAQGIDYQKSS